MRIILTPIGKDLITKLNNENKLKSDETKNNKAKSMSKEKNRKYDILDRVRNKSNHNVKIKKSKNSSYLLNKLLMDQSNFSGDELQNTKEITLKQKKLNFPKNVSENYNIESKFSGTKTILGSTSRPGNTTGFKTADPLNYTLRDVFNDSSINQLKATYAKEQIMKNKLNRIDESNFRTVYETKTFKEKLDENLNHRINPDRINLIKYLNEKNTVSEVLIKKIADYDEEQINKINKICQIVFHNDERDKLFKEIINEKIKDKQSREEIEYKNTLEKMGGNVIGIKNLLDKYSKKVCHIDRYREIHNDTLKYWNRIGIDKIARKPNVRLNYTTSSQQNDPNINLLPNLSKVISTETSS
jgi:hypothetical protein